MSKRQKYWLIQAAQVAVIAILVGVLPVLKLWQYAVLGSGLALYAILWEMEHKL